MHEAQPLRNMIYQYLLTQDQVLIKLLLKEVYL